MSVPFWAWPAVIGLIVILLMVDIRANGSSREPSLRRAATATGAWIAISVAFGLLLGLLQGRAVAEQYFAAYLLEKTLSIDNVFVFAVLFEVLAVPAVYQRRVLYYGVVGALTLRAGFIAAGAALLEDLSWMLYVFGAAVLVAGLRLGPPTSSSQRTPSRRCSASPGTCSSSSHPMHSRCSGCDPCTSSSPVP